MGKKPKTQQPKGTCVFCGRSPPEIQMSKEHIWSDWLQDVLPRYGTRTEAFTTDLLKKPHTIQVKQGDVSTKKVRVVCTECNGGWMSGIVNKAKPIAAKLISGEELQLDAGAQQALANWLGLAALMANQLPSPSTRFPNPTSITSTTTAQYRLTGSLVLATSKERRAFASITPRSLFGSWIPIHSKSRPRSQNMHLPQSSDASSRLLM